MSAAPERPELEQLIRAIDAGSFSAGGSRVLREVIAYALSLEAQRDAAREDEALNESVVELGLQLAAALRIVEAARAWRAAQRGEGDVNGVHMRLVNALAAWEASA